MFQRAQESVCLLVLQTVGFVLNVGQHIPLTSKAGGQMQGESRRRCSCGDGGGCGARRSVTAPPALSRDVAPTPEHEDRPQSAQEMGPRRQDHPHPAGTRECRSRRS